jgi:hypothetical protein
VWPTTCSRTCYDQTIGGNSGLSGLFGSFSFFGLFGSSG